LSHIDALRTALRRDGGVVTDPEQLAVCCRDWRGWFSGAALALVRPVTVEDVQRTVRCCRDRGLALVPQGGNSSMVGGSVPSTGGGHDTIVLSLTGLDRIRAVEPQAWTLTAETGCTLEAIQQAAIGADRAIGLDLGARGTAQVGGLIATNAGGMGVLRYGTMRDQVLGLEAVLPDGSLWNGLRRLRKDNSGYDLKHLLIGSEGTLGVVTAASLRLHPPERHSTTVLLALRDVAAINPAADRLLGAGFVSALELMPAAGIQLACDRVLRCRVPMTLSSPWYLQVRFAGSQPVAGRAEDEAAMLLDEGLAVDAVISSSAAQEQALWEIRDSFSALHRHLGHSFRFDLSVPLGGVPALFAALERELTRIAPKAWAFAFGHLGDGNLHFSACQPEAGDAAAFRALGAQIEASVNEICWTAGGSISAEHGIGRLHLAEMLHQKPAVELQLQRRIKAAFDPDTIFNPGVLVAAPTEVAACP